MVRGLAVFLLCLGASVGVNTACLAASKPNILFILADDLGYGDLSCQNPNSKIQTPRLDVLASQGMCFSSAHAPSGLCTPSRYSLMCGQFCWRSRLKSGVLNAWDEPVIPSDRLTVASMLREQGYATGCFGKWHLGMSWPFVGVIPPGFDTRVKASDLNWNRRINGGPIDHGFDYFFGFNIANEPPYAYVLNDHALGDPSAHYDTATGLQSHWAGPGVPGWDWSRVLPEVVTNAVDWLQRSSWQNPVRPFFLYLALPGPHQPVVPNARFTGTSQAGLYGDYVQELDWAVGQILDGLQTSGATNTLVIFTSDNGPDEFTYQRIEQYNHSSMGALRGIKDDLWEGGHRVPFIARWPGQIAAGTLNSQVICHVDFMRTVADLVGARLPANAAEDSISFLPALVGGTPASVRSSLILESGHGQFGLWTNRWMFIDSSTGDGHNPEFEPLWFKQSRGYTVTKNYPALLYDLTRDLAQATNLYSQQATLSTQLQTILRHQRGIQTWCGTQSGSWTNCGNWSQNSLPAGCDLVYSNLSSGAVFSQILGANVSINSLSLLSLAQPLTLQAGGPFSLTIANGIDMSLASSDLVLNTPLALAESQVWIVTSNRTLKVNGPISLNGSDLMISGHGNVVASNTISGAGRLTMRGSGFFLLGGRNTYCGGTEVSGGGFLVAQSAGALGSGSVDIPNNSTLQVEPGVSLTNHLTIQGNGGTVQNVTYGAITLCHRGHAEIQGPITLIDAAAVGVHAPGGVLIFTGPISGDANVTILPGGGLVVLATHNSYTGSTLIEGKLALAGGNERLPATTQVFLANSTNASLDLGNNHQTIRLLSGGGKVTLANGTLVINQDIPSVYAGALNGTGEVIKTNSGVLTLAGANSFNGTATVSGGRLQVNGVLCDSSVVVRSATLSGTGVITGPVRIEAGGILTPGPGLGTLTVSNSLTLAENSTTSIQIDSFRQTTATVAGLSQIHYGGFLSVSDISATHALAAGQSFQVFSASTATGQFSAIQPSPGPGLAWAFYPANGTLAVVAQPNLRASQADPSHFTVTWSGAGFRLQAQSNSLSPSAANWFDYPGATTSPVTVPFDPANRALFLRLVTP